MTKKDKTKPLPDPPGKDKPERHNARDNKTRFNIRMPNQLLENLKAESTRTGRGMTDIVIEQLWYRYPPE
jgi:predicted DNA binding CopG/RHH family protein